MRFEGTIFRGTEKLTGVIPSHPNLPFVRSSDVIMKSSHVITIAVGALGQVLRSETFYPLLFVSGSRSLFPIHGRLE